MFVVYSPEGQSFIGAAHNLPVLKVDPSMRVTQAKKAGLDDMSLEPDHSNPYFQKNEALKKYQNVQKSGGDRRRSVKVSELMSSPVVTIDSEALIEDAWNLMVEREIHHLPVIFNEQLAGICSKSDVLQRIILDENGNIEEARGDVVGRIMNPQVITTRPETEIREIALALTQYRIGALPVMDQQEHLIGIVTLTDLVKHLSQRPPVGLYV
ncbi:CBS domain-containing protein [Thiomicrorhabdus sp. ZW0627]|uniref:CBS domain-containing protein n=1 Tax=Thiomicrorhabdus sp. ZW0627 TaxID=3039774 RepID=UPI002436E657|nr:CBS domain-containing protein [Thiomicrorhabdus sp. ZW0627]MDG6773201.1 CBS domain-containing protein [Thiomicrorhabdus sp. ZW0627]